MYLNDDKCQGFLLGLVFFRGRGDTFPLSLTFSPKSWYNLFLLEGKYQSCSRPTVIFFEGCRGCDCRCSDKEEIVAERARRALRQERVTVCAALCVWSSRQNQRETMMSALPPGPGPLAWQCGQSNTFPSATTRAFMLLFPDLFGLKHVELNIHPAPCSCTCIAPEIDLWETGCSFCHPTLGMCLNVVIEKSTCWSGREIVQSCTHS